MRRLRRRDATIREIVWGFISYCVYCVVTLYNDWEIRREAKQRAKQAAKEQR
jgi:hypothetical protein